MQLERTPERLSLVVPARRPIRLVVWNLDTALEIRARRESADVTINPFFRQFVATLDERGILQSVVSGAHLGAKLSWPRRLELGEYFLCPALGVSATARGIEQIAGTLNIALRATLLIHSDAAERDEVTRALPDVRAVPPSAVYPMLNDPLMGESLATLEARPRRLLYLEELTRLRTEQDFQGSRDEFLAMLDMQLILAGATREDLYRLRELVSRPNQLGASLGDDELARLCASPDHSCLVVSLEDQFGDCGKVGFVLMERAPRHWTLQLFLFSCRVVRRAVDRIVLDFILRWARQAGVQLFAQFKPTSQNQPLLHAYIAAGFEQIDKRDELVILEHRLEHFQDLPCPGRQVSLRLAARHGG